MIGIEQLSFDPSNTDQTHSVGAYVRAGTDGDLIGSETLNSVEWLRVAGPIIDSSGNEVAVTSNALDVNVTNSLGIDVDLDHTEDSVRLGDGTAFFTSTSENSDIALDVHISNTEIAVTQGTDTPWSIDDNGGSITVDAVDLDIRDLTAASDSVASHMFDGAGTALTSTLVGADQSLDVNLTQSVVLSVDDNGGSLTVDGTVAISGDVNVTQGTSPWVIGDGGSSITVDAVDLDIRDLTHASDSIQLGDGTDLITSTLNGAKQSLDVNVANSIAANDIADTALLSTAKSVTTTTGVLLASQLAARKYMYVQNLGSQSMYIGAAGVTTSNGIHMSKGSIAEMRLGPALSLHAVTASGTADARILEIS